MQVDGHDATSKGLMCFFTEDNSHHQPDHNEHSTLHILTDDKHCDLIVPFGCVFPKDTSLNEGFVESLWAHRKTLDQHAMDTMATSAAPLKLPPPPTIPATKHIAKAAHQDASSESTLENKFLDDHVSVWSLLKSGTHAL